REGVSRRDQGIHRSVRPVRSPCKSGDLHRVGARGATRERRADRPAARAARVGSRSGGGMIVDTETRLIAAHGGELVNRTGERPDGVEELEQLTLTSRELSDLELLACGALSPLEGFMGRDDYESVLETMRLSKDRKST